MKKYKINKGFITQKIDNKTTIFEGEKSVLFTLNDTASLVFQGIHLGWDLEKIIQKMTQKYSIPENQARKDALEFINELESKKIISSKN